MNRTRQWALALPALALLAALAGCAKKQESDNNVASLGGSDPSSSSSQQDGGAPAGDNGKPKGKDLDSMRNFTKCMRDHGVDMPDPQETEGGVAMRIPDGTDKSKIEGAHKECQKFLPNGGAMGKPDAATMDKMRKQAQCMRDHGIDVKDPTEDSPGFALNGISPDDPNFQEAQKACMQGAVRIPGGKAGPGGNGTFQQAPATAGSGT